MRVLITGSAGFIGSAVAEDLVAQGMDVVGIDNFDPYYDRSLKEDNLTTLNKASNFSFVEGDIRSKDQIGNLSRSTWDVIVHLAAKAGVRPSIEDPLGYDQTNITATMHLLELAAKQKNPPRFVFASSSSVYGNNKKLPFSETDPVDHPISPYAATKKAGELLCHTYHHLYGLPVHCLRFFTVFGPRQRPDLAINKFTRLFLSGKPIQMYGDGTSSRDYTYIDDIALGVRKAVERCSGYEVINLGSRQPISLREMIQVVAQACDVVPTIEELPMQPGDVNHTFADTDKAERLLDHKPQVTFEDGIQAFVNWFRQQ
ncbi:MAG: NAD-dependent epimerase/dehydratase family protein [Proteobacteria bacterium]|jgi:UDP-glucuronate 4-epimerase|nr:NAD-dependent epimerase/dehydratase family protein [Pseudomonadota bacterium]